MEEMKMFTPEWYKEQLKNLLNDLLERADDIIDTVVENEGKEVQIRLDIQGGEAPTYTIVTTHYSKKLFENGRN